MANHNLAFETLLNSGLRHRKLDEVLASNCVMDWFGRTFIGQRRVIDFYQNSNATHEHSMPKVRSTESFEDRPYHQLTREQPLENLKNSPDQMTGDEQWFDCDTHSPINLKEGQRTPTHKATPPRCPPAPCRYGISFVDSSDDEHEAHKDGLNLNESGIQPLDSSVQLSVEKDESPHSKRLRREEKTESTTLETSQPAESKFSDLFYLEASGNVTINRHPTASDEVEKRDCKMMVSYRVHKEDSTVVQIALIVYKSSSQNTKSRRNLMAEFGEKSSEFIAQSLVNGGPTSSRCRTVVKSRKRFEESTVNGIATAPPGAKYSKAVKRPMISKHPARI